MKTSLQEFDKKQSLSLETENIIGVDEAGRGPLAGPVVACACYMSSGLAAYFEDVNDSKKLTAAKREEIFDRINKLSVLYGVGYASSQEIDKLNILEATFLAMRRAVQKFLSFPNLLALVDGPHKIKQLDIRQVAVIDGDAKSLSIAAASVIAKILRDRYMENLDKQYPGYGFAAHKGYGTAQHLEALKKLGPTPQHRRSFAPVRNLERPLLFP